MLEIIPIHAFKDNYIWLIHRHGSAVVVDPGDANPVLDALSSLGLQLEAILITHHHADHIGGVAELLAATHAKVFAPAGEHYTFPHQIVREGEQLDFSAIGFSLTVLEVPGHTLDHVAYYGHDMLFCGDTLFAAGCGRLFEGTPAQMYDSLQKLAKLPSSTAVYCAHEYTAHNLAFALSLEPQHPALLTRQQTIENLLVKGLPSLPSSIKEELISNPFLRCHEPSIITASGSLNHDPVAVFAKIREMRNHF